jgi:hypothetical protein
MKFLNRKTTFLSFFQKKIVNCKIEKNRVSKSQKWPILDENVKNNTKKLTKKLAEK